MKKTILLLIFLLFVFDILNGQNTVEGRVVYKDEKGVIEPLPFVNIFWIGTQKGVISQNDGSFKISYEGIKNKKLIFSFVGFTVDTVSLTSFQEPLLVELKQGALLSQVEVTERQLGEYVSSIKPINTEVITTTGLQKLACCNLSESFENNATVDVGYSDAVTGAKQIQMLGLAGVYSQMMVENIPFNRGVGAIFSLSQMPGTWLESIHISKGTSSVINGYESITGQINLEILKPQRENNKFFANLFASSEGRFEANFHKGFTINKNLSNLTFIHGSTQSVKMDNNKDGFLDMPLIKQLNISNRWSYEKEGSTESKFGVNILLEDRNGGQIKSNKDDLYRINVSTKRFNVYDKTGFILKKLHNTNIGLIFNGIYHNQNSLFGKNKYSVTQAGLYGNAIFQSQLFNKSHLYSTGISLMYDNYKEVYNEVVTPKTEAVPGVFFQYTFSPNEKLNIIAGIRYDNHNKYGGFFTPRFHLKYKIFKNTTFRASTGKGFRSPLVLVENTSFLISSRQLQIKDNLKMEEAINYGINITQQIDLNKDVSITINIDYYHTLFQNQIVIDIDKSPNEVSFYNLQGCSFSNSYQFGITAELYKRFSIIGALRYNDVQITTNGIIQQRPFVSKLKGLVQLSYSTLYNKWSFDITNQFTGSSRLPSNINYGVEYDNNFSPNFYTLHAQITRRFKQIEIYLGGENLTNFTQKNPIIDAENPFGQNFDAGLIWGPINGRMFYAGLRLTIK